MTDIIDDISDDLIIRDMLASDIDGALEIEKTLQGRQWTRTSYEETLKRPEAHFYAAVCGKKIKLQKDSREFVSGSYDEDEKDPDTEDGPKKILGYCGCYCALDEAEIVNVAVDPLFRGRGIGRRLVEHLINDRTENGSRIFILEVRVSNIPAISLYESEGFSSCGIRKHFYEMPDEDAVIMRLEREKG